jgi:hypothetical protein
MRHRFAGDQSFVIFQVRKPQNTNVETDDTLLIQMTLLKSPDRGFDPGFEHSEESPDHCYESSEFKRRMWSESWKTQDDHCDSLNS